MGKAGKRGRRMKIVIDIPEERYKDIQRIAEVQLNRRTPTVEQIVANGTPIPKNHGRLIDADELLNMTKNYKSELGRLLKTDPLVKRGVETVENFIEELQIIIEESGEEE